MTAPTGQDRPGRNKTVTGSKRRRRGGVSCPDSSSSARRVRTGAAHLVQAVLTAKRTFDEAFASSSANGDLKDLEPRDRAFARLIAITTLRRLGQIDDVLARFLSKPLDNRAPFARAVLQTATAQLLFLETPAHAVIDVSVQAIKAHRMSQHFSGLVNAVLRRISEGDSALVAAQDAAVLNTPDWLMARWSAAYGSDVARQIADAHAGEPALDLSVKSSATEQAQRLGGEILATGSLRLPQSGRIESLPGYDDGAWWVQDAAAALPARLLGDVDGRDVLDLCAAPGGKTAQLCAAGARVTAVDSSASRMKRVEANLERLQFEATLVVDDAATWTGGSFDAVLLDAPCSATGTIRRHPDIPFLKTERDIADLSRQQQVLLRKAVTFLMPGGQLVFCTCSLEPEEGPDQIARLLTDRDDISISPIDRSEVSAPADWITADGFLRTLPCHAVPLAEGNSSSQGMDGFFAARLVRG
ncbi:MAG: RsmB/NOP family class I SAM-dependent RNA methyltransferase [Hyphomicrobiaceae bacterium]